MKNQLALVVALTISAPVAYADNTCDAYLNAIASYLEYAATASSQGDACQTADYLDFALDASRDAQNYCVGSERASAEAWSRKISAQLSSYDSLCEQ